MFSFVNNYISLFYIAFFECQSPEHENIDEGDGDWNRFYAPDGITDCIENLSAKTFQLLLFTNLVVHPFIEFALPYIAACCGRYCCSCCCCCCAKKHSSPKLTFLQHNVEVLRSKVMQEAALPAYDETDILVDYMDIIGQLGFLALFSCVQPLAPPLVILYIVLEGRYDAYKLCAQLKRPYPFEAKSIGSWLFFIKLLGYVSAFTSIWLLLSTSSWGSAEGVSPPCLKTNFFCFAAQISNATDVANGEIVLMKYPAFCRIFGKNVYFNGPKLALFIGLVAFFIGVKKFVEKIPVDHSPVILDARFKRITSAIFESSFGAAASERNDPPVRPEGYDFSANAPYMCIRGLGTLLGGMQGATKISESELQSRWGSSPTDGDGDGIKDF